MLLHKLWHRNSRLQSWKIKCKKNKVLPCLPYCLLPLNMYIPIFPTTRSNNIQQINHKPFSLFVLLIRQYTLLLELCSLDLGPFVKNRLLIALLMGPFKKVITTTMMTISWMTVCLKGLNDRCPHSSKSAEFIQINWKLHLPRIWKKGENYTSIFKISATLDNLDIKLKTIATVLKIKKKVLAPKVQVSLK